MDTVLPSPPRQFQPEGHFRLLLARPGLLLFLPISLLIIALEVAFILFVVFKVNNGEAGGADVLAYEEILEQGEQASGTVISIDEKTNITFNNEHPIVIGYRYSLDSQEYVDEVESLPSRAPRDLGIGSPVSVYHYENDSAIEGIEPFEFPWWILVLLFPVMFSLFFVSAAGWPVSFALMKGFERRKLYVRGREVEATVTQVLNFAAGSKVRVKYTYPDQFGQRVEGQTRILPTASVGEIKVGDTVPVLVHPKKIGISTWIDPKLAALAQPSIR